jgi:1,4-dihydroxy-6-naphthoate synthase
MRSRLPRLQPFAPALRVCATERFERIQHFWLIVALSFERNILPVSTPLIQTPAADVLEISIAHSPDSDDAFMFYGLATNKVRVPGYRFTHTLCDIESLNRRAEQEAFYDVTAISFHAYPYLQKNYTLMGCGGSVGEGYGPMVVARSPLTHADLGRIKVAVPGTLTTAYLALKIFNPEIKTETVPFDKIIPAVLSGSYDAGLIIHEGQLTYSTSGLYKVVDLGIWWRETTGLVLPLGGNAIRRSLGAESHKIISKALRDSIQHALDHREQALEYAMQFARDLDTNLASRFVSMYVNERTLDYGADGRDAIRKLLDMGYEQGLIPIAPQVDFVD